MSHIPYTKALRHLTESELRLYLWLYDHAGDNPSFKMTIPDLAEQVRIPLTDVAPAQARLEAEGLVEREKSRIVRVGDRACSLRFTTQRDKELASLKDENAALRVRLKETENGDSSGLAEQLSPAHGAVIHAGETVMGRALTYEEVWYLGQLVGEFKAKRVADTIYSQSDAKNPLRATYVILRNGAKGKPFEQKIEEPFVYPKAKIGDDPWAK